MPASPHDALFKSTFEQPDIARSQLELVLPAAVRAHLDLATLEVHPGSLRDANLQQTYTDLLYAVRTLGGEQAFIYVVFEHQSSFDATMPLRMLRYMVGVWERWQRQHEGAKTLPIVLPVLVHHGNGKWKGCPGADRDARRQRRAARRGPPLPAALPLPAGRSVGSWPRSQPRWCATIAPARCF